MKETLNPNTRYFETLHIIRFELSWANRLFQVRSESRSDGFCCYPSVTTHLSSFLYTSYLYNLLVSLYRGGQCGQKNTERDWELKEYLECSCNPQPPAPLEIHWKVGWRGGRKFDVRGSFQVLVLCLLHTTFAASKREIVLHLGAEACYFEFSVLSMKTNVIGTNLKNNEE